MTLSERLISWAQNEENIDGHYLEHGRDCLEAAKILDELLTALERMIATWESNEPFHFGNPQRFDDPVGQARAAIAQVKGK